MAEVGVKGYEGDGAAEGAASEPLWGGVVGRMTDGELLYIRAGQEECGLCPEECMQQLLSVMGGVSGVWTAPVEELVREGQVDPKAAARIAAACELGRRALHGNRPLLPVIRGPVDVATLVRDEAGDADFESFHVLLMDVRHRVVSHQMVTRGTLTSCLVDPRAVFREAVRRGICCLLLAHNHPSGDPAPSQEDLEVTWRMVSAGRMLGIEVLDHVIVGRPTADGGGGFASLRELGLLNAKAVEED